MVCGRFYVLRSAHSWYACVNSQIATQTNVAPNHIVTEADLSGCAFISMSRRKVAVA